MNVYPWLKGFGDLFFPVECLGCAGKLLALESDICLVCISELSRCRFQDSKNNLLARQFWGRINFEHILAFCFHTGKGIFPNLIHQLKYNDQQELAIKLGRMFAEEYYNQSVREQIDYLVPVPLHPSKQKKRGYNQSELIAIGISQIWSVPVKTDLIQRVKKGSSQTKKNRWKRSMDALSVYAINQSNLENDVHIGIVDDVITTGSTIEACAKITHESFPNARISVLSLAFTWS